jgi:hypothetical protein
MLATNAHGMRNEIKTGRQERDELLSSKARKKNERGVRGHRESPKNRSHSGRAIEQLRKDLCCFHQINPQILGKRSRKAIDRDFEWERGSQVSIAGQTFLPTQTIVCSLCSRLHVILGRFLEGRRSSSEFDGLCAKQTKEVPPQMATRPISP